MTKVHETFRTEAGSLADLARHNSGRAGAKKRRAFIALAKELHGDGWPVTALAILCEVSKPAIRRWLQRDEKQDEEGTKVLTLLSDRADLTQSRLREVLSYSDITGEFIWAQGRPRAGQKAGWVDAHGYRKISISRQEYPAHHLAWLYMKGTLPVNEIDHKNGNRDDNRIKNLRDVTRRTNTENQRHRRSNGRQDLPIGTSYDKKRGKYTAFIGHNGSNFALGRFDTPEEASAAYLAAKRLLHAGCTI